MPDFPIANIYSAIEKNYQSGMNHHSADSPYKRFRQPIPIIFGPI